MQQILVYGDSLSWGIVPLTRQRLPFDQRWPGVLEAALLGAGRRVRVIEDCLNGRRSAWDDPFKPGRNGLKGIGQRIEVNSPLALVILLLGTNDFQATHNNSTYLSGQGIAALVRAIRAASIEPGMNVPPILIVSPPPFGEPKGTVAGKFAGAAERARGHVEALRTVAEEYGCAFFDAGSVTPASPRDGVHLDADQHARLGNALAGVVGGML